MAIHNSETSASERSPLLKNSHEQEAHNPTTSGVNHPLSRDSTRDPRRGRNSEVPIPDDDFEYKTTDWWSDLVRTLSSSTYSYRFLTYGKGFRNWLCIRLDASSGWIIAALAGVVTAAIAYIVDVSEEIVESWKEGYCPENILSIRRDCCNALTGSPLCVDQGRSNLPRLTGPETQHCCNWKLWTTNWWYAFGIFGGFSVLYALISAVATTATNFPVGEDKHYDLTRNFLATPNQKPSKSFAMAAGSGIPELKTILNGFEISNLLKVRVLLIKAFGAIFAVASGMCLGKEGPYVHIAACVGYFFASKYSKYRDNGRKLREILAATIASGLCVAFGAPIGGVLFSYEEISTYFPRKTLWKAFVCSMMAAIVLKALNPRGTDKLALFEIDYSASYPALYYIVFVLLGIAGGIWGALFCRLNFIWSRWFRSLSFIKYHPILEILLIILLTTALQYPNPLTKDSGEQVFRNLLTNCANKDGTLKATFICIQESRDYGRWGYVGLLGAGCFVKLVLTTVTFGAKVPSGIIIPALDAGALFGRLLGVILGMMGVKGTWSTPEKDGVPNGLLAMVGAAAFLAGVSRMTISLCVIMFELTGQLDFLLPHMVAIITAKWTADFISEDSIYDVAQSLMAHPFLDYDRLLARMQDDQMKDLFNDSGVPIFLNKLKEEAGEIEDMILRVSSEGTICATTVNTKLERIKMRASRFLGFVIISEVNETIRGFISLENISFGLDSPTEASNCLIRLLNKSRYGRHRAAPHGAIELDRECETLGNETSNRTARASSYTVLDISCLVDRTPLILHETTPAERIIECFGKLGLRYMILIDEYSKKLTGILTKKDIIRI